MAVSRNGRARLGRWLLAANVLASALALGALHTPVLAACAVVAAVSTFLLWWDAEPLKARPAATTVVVVGLGLLAWTALQAVPLPRGFVAALAPETGDIWARALTPLREDGPSWITFSLDPVATRVQLLRGTVYLLTYLGALRVAQRHEGIAFLERAVVVAGVSMAAAALLHPVFGATKVFGAYSPAETYAYTANRLAPLLNANHLAGYVAIGALVAFSSTLRSRESMPRVVGGAVAALLVGANLWAASRGATGALALGAVLTVGLTLATRRRERAKLAGVVATVTAATVGVALIVFSTSDLTRDEFSSTSLSKLAIAKNAFALVKGFPLFGVGRGSFESAFPAVRQGEGHWVYTHPENLLAQWITEWGVPVAVLALVALAWALRPQTAFARSTPPVGAWAAIAATAVHDLVDFSTEVPGVMTSVVLCAAIVTGGSGASSSSSRVELWSRRPRALAIAGAALVLVGVTLTLPFTGGELYNEQRELKDLAVDRAVPRDVARQRLRAAMLRHPAEPYFPFLGAVRANLTREESSLPWVARALERSPVYGRAHLVLARAVYRRSPSQARGEYRLAATQDENLAGYVIKEGPGLVQDVDDALELVPAGKAGLVVISGLAAELAPRLPSTSALLDRELLARDPKAAAPSQRIAAAALSDLKNQEPWCAGTSSCLDAGLAAADRLRGLQPDRCDAFALRAELLAAAGKVDDAYTELERAIEVVKDRSECARRFVSLTIATNRAKSADAALDRLLRIGCETSAECVENLLFAARVEEGRGSRRSALSDYKKASERGADPSAVLPEVARIASAEGLHGEALDAYTKLAAREPGDARWPAAIARERAAVQSSIHSLPR